ncbi:MAG: hypothetical protein ACK6D4_24445, partial [Planctomyces sp.]
AEVSVLADLAAFFAMLLSTLDPCCLSLTICPKATPCARYRQDRPQLQQNRLPLAQRSRCSCQGQRSRSAGSQIPPLQHTPELAKKTANTFGLNITGDVAVQPGQKAVRPEFPQYRHTKTAPAHDDHRHLF